MKKRFLSLLMAAVMLLSLVPVTALATATDLPEATATEMPEASPAEETPAEDEAVAAVLARIAALPDPADFPGMTKAELQAVLDEVEAIFTLTDALTPEQQEQIDFSALHAMYAAQDYLDAAPAANGTVEFKGVTIDCGNGTPTTAENGDLILTYKSGTDTLTIPENFKAIATILVVGGGGGGSSGGSSSQSSGYGGKGGEVVTQENAILTPGEYTVTVGDGGDGVKGGTSRASGKPGADSSLTGSGDFSITAAGGAGGGGSAASGNGTKSDITGTSVTYGAVGASRTSSGAAKSGAANTGNGGSGGYSRAQSGAGGSGVVVIRITDIGHNHSFTYEGNVTSIYAHCTDPNCPSGYNSSISLQLSLNEAGYVSDADMDMWRSQGAAEPVLTYFAASDLSNPLPGAPAEEGNYVVRLMVGGATAQRSYTKKLHVYDVGGVPTEFTPWMPENHATMPTETGNYYLQGIVELQADVTITGKVNLAMNKFAIVENGHEITLADGAELNFYEVDPSPYATGVLDFTGDMGESYELWYLLEGTTLTIGGYGRYDFNTTEYSQFPWIKSTTTGYSTVSTIEHLVLNEGIFILPIFWNGSTEPSKSTFPDLKDITIKSKNFSALRANDAAYLPNLTTVTFAEGVETVNFVQASTFSSCSKLTTVNLPSTLKEFRVHPQTFAGDTAFTTLTLDVNNPYFTCEDNVLYNKDKTELVFAPPGVSTFTPAETVQVIRAGNNADMADLLKNQQINDNIQIELVHNKDGKALDTSDSNKDVPMRKYFYVGELIKAKVTTKDGSPLPEGLFYAWLGLTKSGGSINNANTTKVAGFESPDMYFDGAEYLLSPKAYYGAVKITYFGYNSTYKDYNGTAYCRFAVCQVIDGEIKIVQYKDFTASADSRSSYYTYDQSMEYLANGNTVTMLEGEEKDLRELLGRCGITHMTCNSVETENGSVTNGGDLIKVANIDSTSHGKICTVEALKVGAGAELKFDIVCNNCLYHSKGTSAKNTLTVNVVKRPTVESTCTGAVISELPEGYAYYIGEQEYALNAEGKIELTGLTPGITYTLNMRKIDPENGVTLYTLSTDFTVDHDYSDIRDNGDGTHSTYCQYGCGKYVDTAAHTFVSGECAVCHAKDHTHSFTYKASGTDIIASCTNVDCDLPDGKVTLTLTAAGGTYDGETSFAATLADKDAFVAATGATVGEIKYYKGGETLPGAPKDAGDYTAKVTVTYDTDKTVTAEKAFTVEKAEQTITASATQLFTYGDTGKVVSAKATGALSFAVKSGESVTVSAAGALTISKVGDTTVTITAAETDNYKQATKDVTVTVAAKEIEVPTAETGLSYTGETQTGVKEGEGYTLVNNSATDAGEYTATATPKANYAWVGGTQEPAEIIWEIAKVTYKGEMTAEGKINAKAGSTVDITLPDLPDGAAYSATVTPGNANVSGSVSGTTLSLQVNTELVKGTTDFTVPVGVTGAKNYEDYEVTVTVEPVFHTHSFTYEASGTDIIASCTNVDCDLPGGKITLTLTAEGGTYDGETSFAATLADKDAFVAATGATVGSIEYYKGGAKQNGAPTDAGNYTAKVTVTYDTDKTVTAVKNFTVEKAEQTITASATQNVTYGDTGKAVSVTDHVGDGALSFAVKSGESVTVDADTGALTISKVGDTVITITAAETKNYKATDTDITVKVGAKVIDMPTATSTDFVYNGKEQTYLPVGFDAGTMNITGNKQTNANETGYTVTVTPKANYAWSTEGECKFTWKIGRKTAELQWATPSDLVYSNSAKVPTVAVTNLESGDTCTVTAGLTAANDNINVGTFTFTATALSNGNYELSKNVTSPEYTVVAKPITITGITAENKVYDGTAAATLSYDDVTFDGLVDGEALAVTATGTFANANVGTGKTVNITGITLTNVNGKDYLKNYVLAESGNQATATADITKKNVTVTITPNGGTYAGTITGAAAQFSGLVSGESFEPVLTYSGNGYNSTNVPTNAGTYTVTATLPTGASNYNLTGTVTAEFVIAKATGSVTAPTAKELTYNGQDQALVDAGTSTTGEVQYKLGTDGKYSTGIPKAKAAGDYTVYYKVVGDSNHEDVAESSVSVTIARATYDMSGVTFDAAENVYDGAAHHPTITGTLPTGADDVQVTVSYSDGQTTVGETEVTATFATTSGNYNTPASMTAKQTVTAKPVTLAWGESRFTYDGSEKTVSVTVEGLVSGETCKATLTGNSATNAGDYTAKVTGLSSSNYKLPDDVEKTWKIGKAAQDAPARGEGYTISGTTLTAKSGYELYYGSIESNTFTIAAGGSYSVRKIGDSNHFASPYTAIDTKVTVSVLAVPGNMGTVTGGGSYDIGSDVTVTATARRGYEFVEWQDMSGTQVGTTASYTIEGITAGQTLIAAFKPKDKVMAVLPAVTQDRTYTGREITGLSGGSGWTLVRGDLSGINAGDYSAVIKLADGYDVWPDGTTADKTVGWNIFKAPQNAPTGLSVTDDSIIGTANTMEYRKQSDSDYTRVTGETITGLEAGTYYVRYRETENYYASPITVVVVSEPTLNVVTLRPSDLSNTGVTFNGVVAPYDAEKVSEVGFEYVSIDKNGIVSAPNTISATEDQTFSAQVNNLTEDTDYQVRAYVKRGNTTTYGSLVAFHTPKAAPVAQDNGKIKVNATVEGASAKLIVSIERGNDVIASKQSGSAVSIYTASFDNLPYGNYNVVVRTNNGHYTETKLLSIVDHSLVTVNFTVPAGKLAAIVEVKTPDTPKTAVDGLGEVLTKEDKDAAAIGSKDVEVKLEVEKKAESNAAGAEEIKELLSENDQILFLDMSLLKTTTELDPAGNATSIDTKNIGATNDKVMEIAVPYSDTTKAPKVLRYHNGMAESLTELDARPTAPFVDGTYFVDEGYVFIYASGFSTYAISYAQSTSHGGHGGSANVISAPTGDAGLALYAALSISSMLGMGWVGKKKRDEE